ncbi:hypothetical protein SUGI_0899050 [Cryptomeria japonica]|uniref:transcription repressor MYB6 n=1 Tax=Cryptomeria japonica TaxID=3369 RepID=UPI00241471AD|nr:transcription repressor MYB6 [Cryptomeria japonica]GLJ43295.1 hypothetical protein SUGI_0899050 [Cryptomeria japonica]
MGRAPCCDKTTVKKGPWCPEEDSILKTYIEKNGTGGNWIALPQKAGLKRCGKSCRLRWLNYLRPNIRHGGFSEEEDNIIVNLYSSIGSRWSIIAANLPGRTDNDIKNYWNTRLRRKLFGKRKYQHNRRNEVAGSDPAEKTEVNDLKGYVSSQANTSTNIYGTQASFHGVFPQLFEQNTCTQVATMADTSPSTLQDTFHLNHQQGFDQNMLISEHDCSLKKLIESLESSLIDHRNDITMNTSQMQLPNSNSNNNIDSSLETMALDLDEIEAALPLEYGRFRENHENSESPTVLDAGELPYNDDSLVFSAKSSIISHGSPHRNYQSDWIETFNAEINNKMNLGAYIASMDWNDLFNCTNNYESYRIVQEQREGDYEGILL